jgi:16S rRNA C967 or C1407 C5-methylase (RsmB/RsmF family)
MHGDATSRHFVEGFGEKQFDRILVDAPCASERHLMLKSPYYSPPHLSKIPPMSYNGIDEYMTWAPGRSKANAERQLTLLKAAFSLLKVNSFLVYSTCSINHLENDDVIHKLIYQLSKRYQQQQSSYVLEVMSLESSLMMAMRRGEPTLRGDLPFGEATRYGWHILPDAAEGWGPIYMSVLKKIKPGKIAAAEGGEGEGGGDSVDEEEMGPEV